VVIPAAAISMLPVRLIIAFSLRSVRRSSSAEQLRGSAAASERGRRREDYSAFFTALATTSG
jgi:hypothetical protein